MDFEKGVGLPFQGYKEGAIDLLSDTQHAGETRAARRFTSDEGETVLAESIEKHIMLYKYQRAKHGRGDRSGIGRRK